MSDQANVTSTEAIAAFRTALLVYIGKVRPLLDDASDEVMRAREWLQVTRRLHWENQARLRARALTEAQQALFSAELSKLRAPSSAETAAVHKARRALAEAEEKARTVKRLGSTFDKEAMPRIKQVENLRSVVATDLSDAAHFLERILATLDRYQTVSVSNPAPAAETPGGEA